MDRFSDRQSDDRPRGLAGPHEAEMDRFVNRQNIERYRRLASETTSAAERLRIMQLLTEEEFKFQLELRVAAGNEAT
jgi:hypothetical protein